MIIGLKTSFLLLNDPSAGIDLRRQNLSSMGVRFWRLRSIPAVKELQNYNGRRPITYRYSNEAERAN